MDELTWVWMYNSWLQDQQEKHKAYKDYALFLGAFSNPEMARNISKQDHPDFESSDEEFDQTMKAVEDVNSIIDNRPRRRRIHKA